MKKISIKQKIILEIFGVFLSLVLLETGLRIGGFVYLSLQEYRNKISIKQKRAYRILCLGESTTAFGGKNSYPYQLEDILNQRDIGIKFSVINCGIPGTTTTAIASQLEDNLNKYAPNMVITMMGINDEEYPISYEDSSIRGPVLFLKNFRIYKLTKILWLQIINKAQDIGLYKSKEKKELTYFNNMNSLMHLSKYKELEKRYKKNKEINPAYVERYIGLGWYYLIQGERVKGEEIFKKVLKINPKNIEANFKLGFCYLYQEKNDEAEEIFKKIIKLDEKDLRGYGGMILCLEVQARYREVEEMYKRVEEILEKEGKINPAIPKLYFFLGMNYVAQAKYDEAERIFNKLIEMNVESDMLSGGLAIFYQDQGKYELAEKYFEKANRLRFKKYNHNSITRYNYERIMEIVTQRGIRLLCAQYPVRSVELLKKMFENNDRVIFVDNEKVFKEALKQTSHNEYFMDMFFGDFGHCSPKGNKLLAENIANVILKECFK